MDIADITSKLISLLPRDINKLNIIANRCRTVGGFELNDLNLENINIETLVISTASLVAAVYMAQYILTKPDLANNYSHRDRPTITKFKALPTTFNTENLKFSCIKKCNYKNNCRGGLMLNVLEPVWYYMS